VTDEPTRAGGSGPSGSGVSPGGRVTPRASTAGGSGGSSPRASTAEVCVAACAEAWRGDGAILASPMGLIPSLGARLARLTFAPDLLLTDGEAYLLDAGGRVEGWLPFAKVFTMLAAGRRHVMMGAAQIDRYGPSWKARSPRRPGGPRRRSGSTCAPTRLMRPNGCGSSSPGTCRWPRSRRRPGRSW
jgi:hypothetical protein